jgi:hypothetical protein
MEFLLGIEPIFALGAGLAALAIAPAIGALSSSEAGQKVAETGRELTKEGIKRSVEVVDSVQTYLAEATESWNNLVAEAQAEVRNGKKARANSQNSK